MKLYLILVLVMCPLGIICQFNMTAYRQMPPLHNLEDYDGCLEKSEPSSYCLVAAEILPNDTSVLWNQIADFSSDKRRHFRHDNLFFGVCLNRCKDLVSPLSDFQKEQLYTGTIKTTEVLEFLTEIYTRESDNRIVSDKIVNICLNYNFKKLYDLQVRSFLEYCVSNNNPRPFDIWENFLFIIVGTVLFLVILSSNYDRQLKQKRPLCMAGNEFYKNRLHSNKDTLLTSFSICRNYFRLVKQPTTELGRDLRFFQAFRFFTTMIVVFGHVFLFLKSAPIQNPDYIEKSYHKYGTNIFINGTVIIQVFFVMSSFLLTVRIQRTEVLKKPGISEWGIIILNRYFRIAPSLAFTILLNASILPRLQDGPFWRHMSESEYVLCRETWWRNLLFINNFTMRKSCLLQTWYLAADFQLCVILVAALIIIARYPSTKHYIIGASIAISIITTGSVIYFLRLDPVYQESPDAYRYLFWTDSETMYKGYVPFYTNFGGAVFGSTAAFMYLKYKDQGLNLKGRKSKLNLILFSLMPTFLLVLLSGGLFFHFGLTKPSIWIAIYAGLFRNLWALLCSILVLLMAFKVGLILYKYSSLHIFVPLGRMSFQVYLIHTLIIRCIVGCLRQPVYLNVLTGMVYTLASVVLCFAAAFFLYIFVELPLANLVDAALKASGMKTGNKPEKVENSSQWANGIKGEPTATTVI